MVQATQLRPGMIIIHAGDLFRVTAVHHLTPGNKRGFMQTKMKNLRTGIGTEYKFRSEDRVDQAVPAVPVRARRQETRGVHAPQDAAIQPAEPCTPTGRYSG